VKQCELKRKVIENLLMEAMPSCAVLTWGLDWTHREMKEREKPDLPFTVSRTDHNQAYLVREKRKKLLLDERGKVLTEFPPRDCEKLLPKGLGRKWLKNCVLGTLTMRTLVMALRLPTPTSWELSSSELLSFSIHRFSTVSERQAMRRKGTFGL